MDVRDVDQVFFFLCGASLIIPLFIFHHQPSNTVAHSHDDPLNSFVRGLPLGTSLHCDLSSACDALLL